MAITRIEFEKTFMNPENRHVRRAFLMQALANGPNWTEWNKIAAGSSPSAKAPNFYNDLLFCACYAFFRKAPTRNSIMTMRDFLWPRNSSECGFLADPANYENEERKRIRTTVAMDVTLGFKADQKTAASASGSDARTAVADKASVDIYRTIYSLMWTPRGSMKAWAGTADATAATATLGANVSRVKSDTAASFWIKSLAGRFDGSNTGSSVYGVTFDSEALGLVANDDPAAPQWKMGRYRGQVVIGNRPGA